MPNKELTTVAAETLEDGAIQVEVTLPVRPRRQESVKSGQPDPVSAAGSPSRIPRIARLMALAIKFETMVGQGEVRDYADLARLGYVTCARITQIMNLLLLAPDIQDEILLPEAGWDRTAVEERVLRPLTSIACWSDQRKAWHLLRQTGLYCHATLMPAPAAAPKGVSGNPSPGTTTIIPKPLIPRTNHALRNCATPKQSVRQASVANRR